MIDCVAIGDSIATGYGPVLGCEIRAIVGISSSRIINIAGGKYHAYCIISAGSNDPANPNLTNNLRHIRNQSNCKFYVWVEPINSTAAYANVLVAREHGDITVTFTPASDNVHPASYNNLAGTILQTISSIRNY